MGHGVLLNSPTLTQILSNRARQFHDKPAFHFIHTNPNDSDSISYGQLHADAMAIAAELQTRAGRGDRAWLLYPPGMESIAAFFGCLYAGLVAVPLSPPRRRLQPLSLSTVLDASDPTLILTTSKHLETARSRYGALPELLNLTWIATDLIANERGRQWTDPNVSGCDVAFLQYTSGSTAEPKGVMVSHENLVHNLSLIHQSFGTDEHTTAVFWLPLYHDMGLIGGVLQPVYCGGTSILLSPTAFLQRPLRWLKAISANRATISGGPDFAYDLCVRKISPADMAGLDLSCLRIAFTGAERVQAETLQRFADTFCYCGFRPESFLPVYGLAEATLMVSGGPHGKAPTIMKVDPQSLSAHRIRKIDDRYSPGHELVASGTCLPTQCVLIVDPKSQRPCNNDEVGEIWLKGKSVAQGYFRQPAVTKATFQAYLADDGQGPFLRTGDLGFIHRDQLFVTGRLKDLIIIRGRNHYPEDIERTVEPLRPDFRAGHCAAFAVEVKGQERLVIVQELEPRTGSLNDETAFQAVRQAVAKAHEVEVYSIVFAKAGAIPKTTSGKRRRALCCDMFLEDDLVVIARWTADIRNASHQPVLSGTSHPEQQLTPQEIEVWLVQRIATQLSVPKGKVQVDRPFLELGMGSVEVAEVASDLEQWLNRKLSPTVIYNFPNISLLAQFLAAPERTSRAKVKATPSQHDDQEFNDRQLLCEIQGLSDTEIAAALRLDSSRCDTK
jgi:acyl-CoA synthetase (AMP-forming)/AMP-acid ligase II/acyl carrier protein